MFVLVCQSKVQTPRAKSPKEQGNQEFLGSFGYLLFLESLNTVGINSATTGQYHLMKADRFLMSH